MRARVQPRRGRGRPAARAIAETGRQAGEAAQAAAVAHWPLACTQPAHSPEKKRKPCVGTCENTRPIPSHARQPPPRRAARAPDLRTMRRRPALPARPRPVAPHLHGTRVVGPRQSGGRPGHQPKGGGARGRGDRRSYWPLSLAPRACAKDLAGAYKILLQAVDSTGRDGIRRMKGELALPVSGVHASFFDRNRRR